MILLILMIALVFAALGGGTYGYTRWGYGSWSPLGIILVVFAILVFTGYVRVH